MDPRRYKVESRPIIDLVRDIRTGRLILAAYFQRELVWRDAHKKSFIDTILKGFPFPLIFISRGKIDVERMQATSLLVDGQQRISTIVEYVGDKFSVDGLKFTDLSLEAREHFLKYEVPVIDLDFAEDDPRIKEVFHRLNRTFYSLTEIERLSTEYASSEFMLTAKLLSGQLHHAPQLLEEEDNEAESYSEDTASISTESAGDDEEAVVVIENRHLAPDIPSEFWGWATTMKIAQTHRLFLKSGIFTPYEASRQVHLMFALNLLSTILDGGFFSRNEKIRNNLNDFASTVPNRTEIVQGIERCAFQIIKANFGSKSYWKTKANTFSLLVCLYRNRNNLGEISPAKMKEKLEEFFRNLPTDYQLAAKEAVNRRRERSLRDKYLHEVIFSNPQKYQ